MFCGASSSSWKHVQHFAGHALAQYFYKVQRVTYESDVKT